MRLVYALPLLDHMLREIVIIFNALSSTNFQHRFQQILPL